MQVVWKDREATIRAVGLLCSSQSYSQAWSGWGTLAVVGVTCMGTLAVVGVKGMGMLAVVGVNGMCTLAVVGVICRDKLRGGRC